MKKSKGKMVLVTGAGHGIGKQIAVQFVEQGANIVTVDYNMEFGTGTAEEITRDYVKSLFVQADVSKPKGTSHVWEKVLGGSGRIDTLVLNAGVAFKKKVNEFTFEGWNRTTNINLNGLLNTVEVFYNDFLTNHGSIIYINSDSVLNGTDGAVAYSASKTGGKGLMRGLAKEPGPKGVSVNIIAPRLTDTGDMMRVNYPTQAKLGAVLEKIPVRRYGMVQGVANLAVSLAGKGNSYIQGQAILLDGGRTTA